MKPLRQKMINAMILRGFSPRTQTSYLHWVADLAKHYHCSPDRLDAAQVESYLLHLLKERHLAANTVRLSNHAIRFLFLHVLQKPLYDVAVAYPKRPLKIPDLLTREEVRRILSRCRNAKHHTMLCTCYAAGLRVSELTALEVRNIDSACHVLHVKQGKGAQDREVPLSDSLLLALRRYWRLYHPHGVLFHGVVTGKPISIVSAQRLFKASKAQAGIDKRGGIHSLRHAYATHQLDAGMPIHCLQRAMGHKDIKTTMRYIHWLPHYQSNGIDDVDLLKDSPGG